jgi:hypothetical protein
MASAAECSLRPKALAPDSAGAPKPPLKSASRQATLGMLWCGCLCASVCAPPPGHEIVQQLLASDKWSRVVTVGEPGSRRRGAGGWGKDNFGLERHTAAGTAGNTCRALLQHRGLRRHFADRCTRCCRWLLTWPVTGTARWSIPCQGCAAS